jgi:hypothetical protein
MEIIENIINNNNNYRINNKINEIVVRIDESNDKIIKKMHEIENQNICFFLMIIMIFLSKRIFQIF